MARYQKNRRTPTPASIAGPERIVALPISSFLAGAQVAVEIGVMKGGITAGDPTIPYEGIFPAANFNLEPEHYLHDNGVTQVAATAAEMTVGGQILLTFAAAPAPSELISYTGGDNTLAAGIGFRVPPFITPAI